MEFKQAVITRQGRELMAKLMSGKQMSFTKVRVSSTIYPDGQLENLTALTNVKQETDVQAHSNNGSTVSVVAAVNNEGLVSGYDVNTVGLYAVDPDKGEILYSVSSAIVKGYMPADTGISKSGISFKIYVEVGNAAQVNLEVDPAAVATQSDLMQLKEELELTEAWANSPDGVVDFSKAKWGENLIENSSFSNDTLNLWSSNGATATITNNHLIITFSGGNTNRVYYPLISELGNSGDKFSISFLAYIEGSTSQKIGVGEMDNRNYLTIEPNQGQFKYYSLENLTRTDKKQALSFMMDPGPSGIKLHIDDLKFEWGEVATPYTSAPPDGDGKSFLKYHGLALNNSDNPNDYVWMESPEYTRYKAQVDNENFQLSWNTGQQITRRQMIDFKRKTVGDTTANPHFAGINGAGSLLNPTSFVVEVSQTGYNQIAKLDNNIAAWNVTSPLDNMRQICFKWNLVEQVNRDYPGLFASVGADTLAKQFAFLKANITRVKSSVWGYGSSPTGNLLTVKYFTNPGDWSSTGRTNRTSLIAELVTVWSDESSIARIIQPDGFMYVLAYAEPSDGTTASVVNIDYASLEYTLSFKKSDFDTVTKKEIGEIKEWIAAHS